MRWVARELDLFLNEDGVGCEYDELALLRVALQKEIDKIDGYVRSNPLSTIAHSVNTAMYEYRGQGVSQE